MPKRQKICHNHDGTLHKIITSYVLINTITSPNTATTNDTSDTSTTKISDIISVEDIFFNIISFFFTKNDNNNNERKHDLKSIYSIMLVSKQWYTISTSNTFWIMMSQQVRYIGNNKVPVMSSSHKVRDEPISHGLIGFIKLNNDDLLSLSSPCFFKRQVRSFDVKERATDRIHILNIYTTTKAYTKSKSDCDVHPTYPKSLLKQIYTKQRLSCDNYDRSKYYYSSYLIDWEVRKSNNDSISVLELHSHTKVNEDKTKNKYDTRIIMDLESFIKSIDFIKARSNGLNMIREIIYQILMLVLDIRQYGIMHRDLTLDDIIITLKDDDTNHYDITRRKSFSIQIKDCSKCIRYHRHFAKDQSQNLSIFEFESSSLWKIFSFMFIEWSSMAPTAIIFEGKEADVAHVSQIQEILIVFYFISLLLIKDCVSNNNMIFYYHLL